MAIGNHWMNPASIGILSDFVVRNLKGTDVRVYRLKSRELVLARTELNRLDAFEIPSTLGSYRGPHYIVTRNISGALVADYAKRSVIDVKAVPLLANRDREQFTVADALRTLASQYPLQDILGALAKVDRRGYIDCDMTLDGVIAYLEDRQGVSAEDGFGDDDTHGPLLRWDHVEKDYHWPDYTSAYFVRNDWESGLRRYRLDKRPLPSRHHDLDMLDVFELFEDVSDTEEGYASSALQVYKQRDGALTCRETTYSLMEEGTQLDHDVSVGLFTAPEAVDALCSEFGPERILRILKSADDCLDAPPDVALLVDRTESILNTPTSNALRGDMEAHMGNDLKETMTTTATDLWAEALSGAEQGTVGALNRRAVATCLDMAGDSVPDFLRTPEGQRVLEAVVPLLVVVAIDMGGTTSLASRIPKGEEGLSMARHLALQGFRDAIRAAGTDIADMGLDIVVPLVALYATSGD